MHIIKLYANNKLKKYKKYSKIINFMLYYKQYEKWDVKMQQVTSLQEIETVISQNGEMVIYKNDKNKVIVMSMEEYRNNILDNETEEKLLKSEDDIEKGRTRKATEVIKELRTKYGF